MKVKSCYMAKWIDGEEEVKEYTEELGCTIRHCLRPNEETTIYTIEDATGNKSVLVAMSKEFRANLKSDVGLRVVVDDIHEAIEYYKAKGYKILVDLVETETNFLCSMEKDAEYRLIFQHKKHARKLADEELNNIAGGRVHLEDVENSRGGAIYN